VTSVIHPERVAAHARGDLAERMVYVAWGMARLVRDEDAGSIGTFLATLTPEEKDALLVVQAAMIPAAESVPGELLSWVTWDEHGFPLAGQDAAPATVPDMAAARIYQDCGTYRAHARHKRAGHSKAQTEACGCAQAERDYRNARYAASQGGQVGAVARKSRTEDRLEDYAERRARGDSIGEAAGRVGVSRRTADRYEARLKAAGPEEAARAC
jgi:hypothetical protein